MSVYEVKRGLLTADVQKQMKKLQTFYLSELVRLLNIDATMRSTASENTKIGAFVAKISKHLHEMVNKYHDAGVQAEGE